MALTCTVYKQRRLDFGNRRVRIDWSVMELKREIWVMAANSSNGEQQTTSKPPPLPSPLRFSKFFSVQHEDFGYWRSWFYWFSLGGQIDGKWEKWGDCCFTGSKDNLRKWIGHPKFELIRHDVTEPSLVEVDQIYHLACPASPIFYKYNPVKTIKTMSLAYWTCWDLPSEWEQGSCSHQLLRYMEILLSIHNLKHTG